MEKKCDVKESFNPTEKDDIASGISIDTQYPLEKFVIKWRISNFSKIFNYVETVFFTTAKSTAWRLRYKGSSHKIELWKYADNQSDLRVYYEAVSKFGPRNLQVEGSHEFRMSHNVCEIMRITSAPNSDAYAQEENIEADVLNFKCTMKIFGHTITKQVYLPNVQHFRSTQINYDLENLFETKEHSDMIISDGRNKIPVHKAILCARSPVFNAMFQQNMLESKNNEVEVRDIEFDILHGFLSFLYSGKVEKLSFDSAMKFYYVADKYEVRDLLEICSEYLQTNLSVENCCNILKLSDQHKDDELKESVIFFIQMHAPSVKLSQGWNDLIATDPRIITHIF